MGFRFRKSINLGGGFRINLSKSGVGYSWGAKGFRITKTARGTVRGTVSIPGTGISYVTESKGTRNTPPPTYKKEVVPGPPPSAVCYDTQNIENTRITEMVPAGLKDVLFAAKCALIVNKLLLWATGISFIWGMANIIFFGISFALFLFWILFRFAGGVKLTYDIDPIQQERIAKRMEPMLRMANSQKLWRKIQTSKVFNTKYTGGAGNLINRVPCKAKRKAPFPFKTKESVLTLASRGETLVFLPETLVIIQGLKIGAINYDDIIPDVYPIQFVEDQAVPKDSKIVSYTWKYVNKSGGPDRRFNNNRQLPVCLYGEFSLKAEPGLNTVILFSNVDLK